MYRLLLLEDDLSLADGLEYALLKEGFTLDIADTVAKARENIRRYSYDLCILDITLPDGNGLELCQEMRKDQDMTPILFLTAADEEVNIIRGLDSGGDDYLTKPFKLGELCSRIKALIRRSTVTGRQEELKISGGPVTLYPVSGKAYLRGKLLELTKAEYSLLYLMIKHKGQVMTRIGILNILWDGNGSFVDNNTLSVYIRRLREKIEAIPSQPCYLVTVRGIGYRWEEKI